MAADRAERGTGRSDRGNGRLDQPRESRRTLLPRPDFNPESFGRASESFARFMGTARFLVYMTAFVVLWLLWNTLAPPSVRFDPYAFIFLTLMLSLQASYAAPLILLAQNRLADRDRVALEQDRARDERNLADTEYLTREVAALRISLRDMATRDFVRSELRSLLDEMEDRFSLAGPSREDNRAQPGAAASDVGTGEKPPAGATGRPGATGRSADGPPEAGRGPRTT